MGQEPQGPPVGSPGFRVLWHPASKDDLSQITPSDLEALVEAAEYRLSRAPQYIGQPLKGTTRQLWKIRFSQYRILDTIHLPTREVWVLSVQKRDVVYRDRHVQGLLHLALALHEAADRR